MREKIHVCMYAAKRPQTIESNLKVKNSILGCIIHLF